MIELKRNEGKMPLRPRGETWEWYAAEVGNLGAIHVHNKIPSGKWTYRISTIRQMDSNKEYSSKDEAFVAALSSFSKMATQVKSELQDALAQVEL